ncbi:hypothetical protein D3C78_1608170 [compost metagenome]
MHQYLVSIFLPIHVLGFERDDDRIRDERAFHLVPVVKVEHRVFLVALLNERLKLHQYIPVRGHELDEILSLIISGNRGVQLLEAQHVDKHCPLHCFHRFEITSQKLTVKTQVSASGR